MPFADAGEDTGGAVPVYRDRDALRDRPSTDSWVDIDDIEFFALGNSDRIADGEEPTPTSFPDPIEQGEACLHEAHDIAIARRLKPTTPQERIVVLSGEAIFESESSRVTVKRAQWIDVPQSGALVRSGMVPGPEGHRPQVEIARIAGHWSEALRTAIFRFGPGRPCEYHYHDGDEYWFIFRGHLTMHLDGVDHEMAPGSVLAAGFGEEHGVLDPQETFEGVGFATQLEGQLRDGHLWRSVHGTPDPIRQNLQAV
jgi:mannose-6-phosphate isomerase-like protein (cupin superfamily)